MRSFISLFVFVTVASLGVVVSGASAQEPASTAAAEQAAPADLAPVTVAEQAERSHEDVPDAAPDARCSDAVPPERLIDRPVFWAVILTGAAITAAAVVLTAFFVTWSHSETISTPMIGVVWI